MRRAILALALAAFCAECSAPQAATPVPFQSGGLGLTKAEWERTHQPAAIALGSYQAILYDLGHYEAAYWQVGVVLGRSDQTLPDSTRIISIRLHTLEKPRPASEITATIRILLPDDAQLEQIADAKNQADNTTQTQRYHSTSLEKVYPPLAFPAPFGTRDPWKDSAPGTIFITITSGSFIHIQAGDGIPPAETGIGMGGGATLSCPQTPCPTPPPPRPEGTIPVPPILTGTLPPGVPTNVPPPMATSAP